jgi:acyl carrier protein
VHIEGQPDTDIPSKEADQLDPRALTADEVGKLVLSVVAAHMGVEVSDIPLDEVILAQPGMESVRFMNAIGELEDRLDVLLPDERLAEPFTPRELCEFIAASVGAS